MKRFSLVVIVAIICCSARILVAVADEAAGDAFMEKNEYRKAISEYRASIDESGETEALLVKLAKAYDAERWYGQSVQVWEKYIELAVKSYSHQATS